MSSFVCLERRVASQKNSSCRPCCYIVCERLSRVAFRFVHAKSIKGEQKNRQSVFRHLFSSRGRVPLKTMGILLTRKSGVCACDCCISWLQKGPKKIKDRWRHYFNTLHHYKSRAPRLLYPNTWLRWKAASAAPHKKRISSKSQRFVLCARLRIFSLLWAGLEIKTRVLLKLLDEKTKWCRMEERAERRARTQFECTPLFVEWIRALRGKSIH